jgi:hypothetical protein
MSICSGVLVLVLLAVARASGGRASPTAQVHSWYNSPHASERPAGGTEGHSPWQCYRMLEYAGYAVCSPTLCWAACKAPTPLFLKPFHTSRFLCGKVFSTRSKRSTRTTLLSGGSSGTVLFRSTGSGGCAQRIHQIQRIALG